jgi:hypothetical protein
MSISAQEAQTTTVEPENDDLAFEVIGEVDPNQPEPSSVLCAVGCR